MSPRTIEQIRAEFAAEWSPPGRKRATILDPQAGECEPLFTSRLPDCLTHITRFITDHPEWTFTTSAGRTITHEAYQHAHAWCGTIMRCRQIALADASGFVCWKCIERCEELGLDTFGMIPDTGCAVSGGKRGRKTPNQGTVVEADRAEGDVHSDPWPPPVETGNGDVHDGRCSHDAAGAPAETVPAQEGQSPGGGGLAALCVAWHDGHDCRRPGECRRALLALCERTATRPAIEAEPDRRQLDRTAA